MLQTLAERDGVTASDWVRLRVRQSYGQGHPLVASPRRPKTKRK